MAYSFPGAHGGEGEGGNSIPPPPLRKIQFEVSVPNVFLHSQLHIFRGLRLEKTGLLLPGLIFGGCLKFSHNLTNTLQIRKSKMYKNENMTPNFF